MCANGDLSLRPAVQYCRDDPHLCGICPGKEEETSFCFEVLLVEFPFAGHTTHGGPKHFKVFRVWRLVNKLCSSKSFLFTPSYERPFRRQGGGVVVTCRIIFDRREGKKNELDGRLVSVFFLFQSVAGARNDVILITTFLFVFISPLRSREKKRDGQDES